MKRFLAAGMGAALIVFTVPFISAARSWQWSSAVAQNPRSQQALQLVLAAEKQVVTKDQKGQQKVSWQNLTGEAKVMPGDVLKYTLTGENRSDRPLKNVILNQPIPQGMVYVLKSTDISTKDAKVTYSVDGGRNFTENPTVKVRLVNGKEEIQPAPASAYTNIRVLLPIVAAKTTVKATYLTQVR